MALLLGIPCVCARVLYDSFTTAFCDSAFTLDTGKYCEFARLFGEEKFSEAGSLLVELLEAEVVPKRYTYNSVVYVCRMCVLLYIQGVWCVLVYKRDPFVYSLVCLWVTVGAWILM